MEGNQGEKLDQQNRKHDKQKWKVMQQKQQCYKGGFSGFRYNDEGLESDLKSRPIDKYVN